MKYTHSREFILLLTCTVPLMLWELTEGSATEQNGVQDFKISEISGFLWDFKISYGFQDLNEISQDLTRIL